MTETQEPGPSDRPLVVLPTPEHPRVSVLVLGWREASRLHACLGAVAAQVAPSAPFETIVVLNGASPDVVAVVEQRVSGARVVRSSVNLGFGGGCNLAATVARGEYLVLLNDDTEVEAGWLEALTEAADDHPDAGAVGSRIHDPAGQLQEAGGILWSDGTIWHVGRLLPRRTPRYRYLRAVDYSSACSLLVRRSTWDAVGGFDDAYFPGYYEDLDLCMAIRRLGQRIIYQPRSRLLHHGGGEVGSLDWRTKSFVAGRSRRHFLAKWEDELAAQPAPPPERPPAPSSMEAVEQAVYLARRRPVRALVLADGSGDYGPMLERNLTVLAQLSSSGYAVTAKITGLRATLRDRLARLGVELIDELDAHLSRPSTVCDVVLSLDTQSLWAAAQVVEAHQPAARVIHASDVAPPTWALACVDVVLYPSEACATAAGSLPAAIRLEVLEPHLPPLGADLRRYASRRDLLTVSPDPAWLRELTGEVMSHVRSVIPWARLHVAGRAALDLAGPSVSMLGEVAQDRALYGRVRAVIAPSAAHAWAALAEGVPVVAPPAATAALPDALASAVIAAETPADVARHLVALLTDRRTWEAAQAAVASLPRRTDPPPWSEALERARRGQLVARGTGEHVAAPG